MAPLRLLGSEVRAALDCGCTLERLPDGAVAFTFCDPHGRLKITKQDPNWPAMARAAVASVARRLPRFTTDDVWEELAGDGVQGGDPRAIGPIMDRAAAEGICQKTDEHVKTARKAAHGRPVRVWLSNVVRGSGGKDR